MKIIAFSLGDSNKTETWSNVPYYFLKALEQNGIDIIRVDITPFKGARWLRVLINRILALFKTGITFERTALYDSVVRRKMLSADKKNPDAEILLSFDFSHSIAGKTDKKTLLFCDWDIKYYITHILGRTPNEKELRLIEKQKTVIDGADWAVTIFPNAFEEMKKEHPALYYFGTPVNLEAPPFDIQNATEKRFENKRLLFIGRKKYLSGAKALAEALESFNAESETKLYADIIGMTADITGIKSEYITHCGYLNKDNAGEWKTYSALLENAFFFVNTTENWVGASSVLETAFLGIPCIINPNGDLIKTFGSDIPFGYYCEENSADEIKKYLEKICALPKDEYEKMSRAASKAVEGFTYENYIKNIIKIINS